MYAYVIFCNIGNIVFNPLTTIGPHHIEASQLICIANQLTGFYMMWNIGHKLVQNNEKSQLLKRPNSYFDYV